MFTISEITALMDKMKETGLGEVKLKDGEFEVKIKAKDPVTVASQPAIATTAAPIIELSSTPATPIKDEVTGNLVKSPIVGTFYASAAPDKPAFVKVGQKVKKGDVLFVIESMKLMNEIQSEFDGEVVQISVTNAQPVEFNQPIMIIA